MEGPDAICVTFSHSRLGFKQPNQKDQAQSPEPFRARSLWVLQDRRHALPPSAVRLCLCCAGSRSPCQWRILQRCWTLVRIYFGRGKIAGRCHVHQRTCIPQPADGQPACHLGPQGAWLRYNTQGAQSRIGCSCWAGPRRARGDVGWSLVLARRGLCQQRHRVNGMLDGSRCLCEEILAFHIIVIIF